MERVVSLCRVECVWLYELCGVVVCGYMQLGELGCWIIGWSGLYKSAVYFCVCVASVYACEHDVLLVDRSMWL